MERPDYVTHQDKDNIRSLIEEEEDSAKRQAATDAQMEQASSEVAALESGERIGEEDTFKAKEASEFGVKENLQELSNAVTGAVRDELSSVLTGPERLADIISGEMAAEGEDYEPDWNPLGDYNPQTKTKWGNIVRGALGYATFALPVGAVFKSIGIAGKAAKGIGLAGKGTTAAGRAARIIVPGATMGAAHDLIAETSQDDNILGALNKKAGWLETPLTTLDTDSPWVKTMKNVVEGMGIGVVFDVAMIGLKKGVTSTLKRGKGSEAPDVKALKEANPKDPVEKVRGKAESKVDKTEETNGEFIDRKVNERNEDIDKQIVEQAQEELKTPGYGDHKNPDLSDDWQGNPNSTADMYELSKQTKRIHTDLKAENGSTDNITTQASLIRMANEGGMPISFYKEKAQELLGNTKFRAVVKELEKEGYEMDEVFKDAFESAYRVVNGRNPEDVTAEEYWKQILDDNPMILGKDQRRAWTIENVLVADIINASLFSRVRDLSKAALEVADAADLRDIGTPLERVKESLMLGMYNVKRSRFLISKEFSKLKAQGPVKGKKSIDEALENIKQNNKEQVDMMIELVKSSDDDDLMRGVLEAFSMSNDIRNFDDFDAFMRRRLRGQPGRIGDLIRELQGVMINSVLSGPKTPLRAILGTSTAVFTRPMAQMLGGLARFVGTGDATTIRQSLASMNAMMQTVPEATEYFFKRVNGYFSNEIHTTRSRYAEFNANDEQWKLMGKWMETRGTDGDKAAYRIANLARSANQNNFLTYSTKLMAATDDAFSMILARARARERAFNNALSDKAAGSMVDIDQNVMRKYEDNLYAEIFDPVDGSVRDDFLEAARKEATLTTDISGFGKSLDDAFSSQPLLKPFYLFARTGINGLNLSFKHFPGLNFLVKEFNDIARATPDTLDSVAKYGINNADDLINAQALQNGRLMLGGSVITMASMHYLNGGLTGNGPTDFQTRKVWEDAGWVPRSIKLGNTWVSYESLEPFGAILASIADLGDNQRLMGNEFVEKGLFGNVMILAKGMISKTYLQGLKQLTDLFSDDPKKLEKVLAGLANNSLPLSSLRNEIGRVITPYQREMQAGIADNLRNRNLMFEQLTTAPLPIKYDILTGEPIKDWNPLTRMFNAISPIQLNLDQSEGRKMLFKSNYDMRMSTMTAPDATDLGRNPRARSKFQEAIGKQGLGKRLDQLAKDPMILESIQQMERDLARGDRRVDPMTYRHNKIIKREFDRARRQAWASLSNDPEVYALKKASRLQRAAKQNMLRDPEYSTQLRDRADEIFNMTNR